MVPSPFSDLKVTECGVANARIARILKEKRYMAKQDIDPDKALQDMLWQEAEVQAACEELRVALNKIIELRQLKAEDVLATLARISAGYIHQMQRRYDNADLNDVVEERFQQELQAFLTDLDMRDVNKEIAKMTNEELN